MSDKDFSDVNTAFGDVFNAFSPPKTFAAVGSTIVDVTFQVAARNDDRRRSQGSAWCSLMSTLPMRRRSKCSTRLGKTLGTFIAPVRSDANGLSFVGVKFESALIARVRITSGTGALGAQAQDVSNGGTADLVVMDDFLFSEPVPQ